MDRFDLVSVAVSAGDIRKHLKNTNFDIPPSAEELVVLTQLTFRFVPIARALEAFAESIAGAPGVN